MRVAFAGTPAFAAESLRALLQAGHQVPLVLTQPDRPAGRGMKLQPSPVKVLAQERGIPVCQPAGMRLDGRHAQAAQQAHSALQAAAPDLMVVAAYGLILPTWALNLPPLGCVNVHASLLPRWRGAAPIHRAIEAGDTRTGVTLMQMDEGLDTGAMLRLAAEPILPDDTTASLHDRLAVLGGRELVHLLAQSTPWPAHAQPEQGVSYAHKIEKAEARLDWRAPAALLARRVRAFDPFPGASLLLDGVVHKVWAARTEAVEGTEAAAAPGTVLSLGEDGLRLRCGEGVLRLLSLQRPGGRRLPVAQWRQGVSLATGDHLPLPDDASA